MSNNKYYKKLVGSKCYLSPLCSIDNELFAKWLNDLDVAINVGIIETVLSKENEKMRLEKLIEFKSFFSIVDISSDDCIGRCGYMNLDRVNRNCEIGVFIGNKDYWGKGYGYESTMLLLEYCFNVLNLHNVMLGVYSFNKRAITCYEKCGFKEIGNRRQSKIINGKKHDMVFMDMLRDEYIKISSTRYIDI